MCVYLQYVNKSNNIGNKFYRKNNFVTSIQFRMAELNGLDLGRPI